MLRGFTIALIINIVCGSCADHSFEKCHEGVVIGKIRSGGGGIAVSVKDDFFGSHEWRGHQNVIEALNIPLSIYEPGSKIFFTGRHASEDEKNYPITADGDESNKPLVMVITVSDEECPASQ